MTFEGNADRFAHGERRIQTRFLEGPPQTDDRAPVRCVERHLFAVQRHATGVRIEEAGDQSKSVVLPAPL